MTPEDITSNSRLAGLVKRYHTWPVLREQTNAEHSWQVMRIWCELFGIPGLWSIWYFILIHDLGEIRTGDLPYPTKSLNPQLKRMMDQSEHDAVHEMGHDIPLLNNEQIVMFKIAHMLEMWEYGQEEKTRGNGFAGPIVDRTWFAVNDMITEHPEHAPAVEQFRSKKCLELRSR